MSEYICRCDWDKCCKKDWVNLVCLIATHVEEGCEEAYGDVKGFAGYLVLVYLNKS